MPVRTPNSTPQNLIFPYLELSNGFAYSHHRLTALRHGLPKHFLDKFFVALHKSTAVDLNQIALEQKRLGYIMPFVAVILVIFGALMGIFYRDDKHSFLVQLSAGIILATSALFIVWLIIQEIRLWKMRRSVLTKVKTVIQETNSYIDVKAEIILPPKLDFPYWLEFKFQNPPAEVPEILTPNQPMTAMPMSPGPESEYLLHSAKYLMPPDLASSYKVQSPEYSKNLAIEEVKLIVQ